MFLENWLRQKIQNVCDCSKPLDRDEIDRHQLSLLQLTLQRAYQNSSFYKKKFDEHGIAPDKVRSLEDFAKLPFTNPDQLAQSPYRFLCLSQAAVEHVCTFITSGTTGPQKKIFWTQGDLDRIIDFMSAGIGVVANPSDVVLVALPDGRPNSQSDLLIRGVIKLGANPIAAGFDWETEAFFNAVKQNRPAVIFGYTSRIFRMTQELQSTHDLASMGVRALFLASEYLPAPMRSNLQKIWNCRVHTHYGLTEMGLGVAIECSAKEGYHFNEADLLLEIVDPKTGEAAKLGEEGEIVFTTLSREAMPLIRYRTHDISRIIPGPCSCGADGLLRFGAVRKRLESILQLQSGDELYPSLLDDLLFEVSGLVDYQAVLERHGGKEKLCVKIEMANPQRNSKSEIIHRLSEAPAIARAIALGTMQIPELDFVNPGALKIASRAKKLISDQR